VLILIGFVVVLGAVLGGFLMAGGTIAVLVQPSEFVVIGGAAVGSLLISTPPKIVKMLIGQITGAFGSGPSRSDYVDLLAMLGESNLPPGGLPTVRDLAHNLHLRPGIKALHAGCNTGFLSSELARRTGASITGIDVNPNMAEAGNLRAKQEGLEGLIHYEPQDMRAMTFADGEFDVVLSGGALAFVDGHESAVAEQIRVTKECGLLGDVQLYYHEEPPAGLLDKVSENLTKALAA